MERGTEIKFYPDMWKKIYFEWMRNIKDWCISRQLWWGHRIPAWYCACGETIVEKDDEYILAALNGKCWIVDPIDGTAPFANNIPTWGISLGFSEKGRLSDGAIFLPFSGELYMTFGNSAWMADNVSLDPMPKTLKMKKMRRPRANFAKGGMLSVSQDIVKRGSLNLKNPVQPETPK